MLSLQEYDDIALKILSNWRKRVGPIEHSEELLGRMVRFMAIADWKYNEVKSKGMSEYDYRQMRAIYAIREYIKEKKITRNRISLENYYDWYTDSPEYNEVAAKKIKFVLYNSGLKPKENEVISHYLSGMTIGQVAERLGIKYSHCRNIYSSALKKMQKILPKEK